MPKGDPSVCAVQADTWRQCTEDNITDPAAIRLRCEALADNFDKCVLDWRGKVGPSVQLRGEGPGEPPEQCQPMSCLIANCLHRNKFDFDRCKLPMEYFKRCVKGLYGSEYIL
eukprot:GILI01028283.1.p1 GENE.GILI01028283.1~~GILI01028283.1.p1  ORF type:complete len:113 (-),score=12.04 GILI01028283.1:237-575(-)